MRTYITAFPIDRILQEKLGIYHDGNVKNSRVGYILHQLISAGYKNINSFVEITGENNTERLTIHMSK